MDINGSKKDLLPRILLGIALFFYFAFGLYNIKNYITFDEHFWLYNTESDRIHQYWQAIADRDWKDTRINDKPGITLAWTSGIALLLEKNPEAQVKFSDGTLKIFNPAKTQEVNMLYRFPILLVSGLFSLYFFWILRKVTGNEWVALWSAILMLLSPVLLGISQIVNPDSLFWIFGAASIFTFFAFLQDLSRKFGILTALFFGLAMASKYVAIIFIPFFFFMILADYLFNLEKYKTDLAQRVIKNALAYLGIIAGGLLIFSLMMPAVFVKWDYFYKGTIGFPGMEPIFWTVMLLDALILLDAWLWKSKILIMMLGKLQFLKKILPRLVSGILLAAFVFVLINWMFRHRLLDLSDIPYDFKRKDGFDNLPYLYRLLLEVAPMAFGLTPVALISLLYLWTKTLFGKISRPFIVFVLSSFFLIFYVAVIEQGLLVTIRYSIILFPLSLFFSALALEEFIAGEQSDDLAAKNKKVNRVMLVFSFILALLGSFFTIMAVEQKKIVDETAMQYFYDFHRVWTFIIVIGGSVLVTLLIYKALISIGRRKISAFCMAIAILVLSLPSLWLIKPFYFAYTSDMLPKKYTLTGTWGYGGYEAAQYLNTLPGSSDLTVWSDSYGFCEFFVGKCIHKEKVNLLKYKIDYYVRMAKPQLNPAFPHPMERDTVWDIAIDGRYKNFVKVYKAADPNKPIDQQDDWGL